LPNVFKKRQTSESRFQSPTSARAVPRRSAGVHEELLAEIQKSAETDASEDPADDEQADNVTFGHKMMYPAEPN